jgi:hypothetical protein
MYFSFFMLGQVQSQAGSMGQANSLSKVYGCYNAKSQAIEGVFIKKVYKNFHRCGIGSQPWMSL